MREIKFKAVHKQFGVSQTFLVSETGPVIFTECTKYKEVMVSRSDPDLVFLQYTGLNDQNEVDIYEGDLVKFTYWWFDGDIAESNLTGTIVYSDNSMSFQLKGVKNKEWERHTGYTNDIEYLTPFSELNFCDADFVRIGSVYDSEKNILEIDYETK